MTAKESADDARKAGEASVEAIEKKKEESLEALENCKKEKIEEIDQAGSTAKEDLDASITAAGTAKEELDESISSASSLDRALGEKVAEAKQLKNDLQTSGEKQVSDINNAGAVNLKKVQDAAEEIIADRQQISKNIEDIEQIKEAFTEGDTVNSRIRRNESGNAVIRR